MIGMGSNFPDEECLFYLSSDALPLHTNASLNYGAIKHAILLNKDSYKRCPMAKEFDVVRHSVTKNDNEIPKTHKKIENCKSRGTGHMPSQALHMIKRVENVENLTTPRWSAGT